MLKTSKSFSNIKQCSFLLNSKRWNHYETLGISRNATKKEIKAAYISKCKEFHPDKHPNNPKMHKKFVDITAAYEVLSSKSKKNEYDMPTAKNSSYRPQSYNRGSDRIYWDFKARQKFEQDIKNDYTNYGRKYGDFRDSNTYKYWDFVYKLKNNNVHYRSKSNISEAAFLFGFLSVCGTILFVKINEAKKYNKLNRMKVERYELIKKLRMSKDD